MVIPMRKLFAWYSCLARWLQQCALSLRYFLYPGKIPHQYLRQQLPCLRRQLTDSDRLLSHALYDANLRFAELVPLRFDETSRLLSISDEGRSPRRDGTIERLCRWEGCCRFEQLDLDSNESLLLFAALFCGSRVWLHAGTRLLEFNSERFLHTGCYQLHAAPKRIGIEMRVQVDTHCDVLCDWKEPQPLLNAWRRRVQVMISGYGQPVTFNAEEMPRPYALDYLDYISLHEGELHLDDGPIAAERPILMYCDGLPVQWPFEKKRLTVADLSERDVIHLNPVESSVFDVGRDELLAFHMRSSQLEELRRLHRQDGSDQAQPAPAWRWAEKKACAS